MKVKTPQRSKLKTTLLGKTTVGKTSITCRLAYDHCNENTYATVGATFITATRGNIKYNIWDTGGQERFRCLMPMYLRDSKIIIFVFDVTDTTTLDNLSEYISDLSALKDYLLIIVGNKIDLLDDEQFKTVINITENKLNDYSLHFGDILHGYSFISAKTGENFDSFLWTLNSCAKLCRNNESNPTEKGIEHELSPNTDDNNTNESQCNC